MSDKLQAEIDAGFSALLFHWDAIAAGNACEHYIDAEGWLAAMQGVAGNVIDILFETILLLHGCRSFSELRRAGHRGA